MVDFNPKPDKANDPSYLGMSQGPIRSSFVENDSSSRILKGIAGGIDLGTKVVYSGIVDSIQQEVNKQTDAIRGEAGVDEAAAVAATGKPPTSEQGDASNSLFTDGAGGKAGGGTPPGVARLGESITSLREAYEQGRLSNSYYFGRLEAMVRNVRAQYPGFREEVDKVVQSVTGVTPANALRKSLVDDMDRAARAAQASQSDYQRFVVNKAEFLPPDYYDRIKANNPYKPIEVYEHVARREQEKTNLEMNKSRIALASATDKYAGENAERVGIQAMDNIANRSVETVYGRLLGPEGIQTMIAKKGDRPFTPDEQKEIRLKLNEARLALDNEAEKVLTAPLVPGDTRTLSSVVGDPGKLDAIKKRAHARINALEDALLNGKTGILSMDAVYVEASKNSALKQILEKNDFLRKLSALGSLPGGADMVKFHLTEPTNMSNYIKSMQNLDLMDLTLSGQSLKDSHVRGVDAAKTVPDLRGNDGSVSPQLNRARVENAKRVLLDPKSPPEAIANVAKGMFGTGNIGFLEHYKPSEQALVYQTMVTPAVHKKMEELKGTNPEIYRQYRTWAIEYGFVSQAKAAVSEITNIQKNQGATINIEWSSDLGRFKFEPTETTQAAIQAAKMGDRRDSVTVQKYGTEVAAVNKLNRLIDTIQPILKSEKGDPAEEMDKVLKDLGFNPDAKKEDTLLQTGAKWLGNALMKGWEKYTEKAKEEEAKAKP
jgi:hypothetical protein